MRFKQQPISSTYIWDKFKDLLSTGNKLRWRTILLLILQILALISVILALTKPFYSKEILIKPGVCFLIDVSASMNATDETNLNQDNITRLNKAKNILIDEINKLPSDTNIMIFLCASYAKPLNTPTTNKTLLINKIKSINTTDDEFTEREITGKISAWLKTINQQYQLIIITDGGMDMKGHIINDSLDNPLKIMYVGKQKDNIGLNGLRVFNFNNDNSYQVQFYIKNNFDINKSLNILLKKDNNILNEVAINATPGISKHIIELSGEIKTGSYSVEIIDNKDFLSSDDICFLSVNPDPQIKILVIGKDNPFINAALSYNNILYSTSDGFPLNDNLENWDIIISNYIKIPKGIKNNLLCFGEIPEGSSLKFGQTVNGFLKKTDLKHSILRYIDWGNIRVLKSPSIIVDTGKSVLSKVNNLPVLIAWEENNYKHLMCSIDIFNSDIGLSGSFPILLQNYIAWCVPQNDKQLKYTFNAGETIVRYESPQWKVNEKNNINIKRQGNKIYLNATKAGVYNWEKEDKNGTISVNIPFNETNISTKKILLNKDIIKLKPKHIKNDIPVEKIPLLLFLVLLIIEWFLWIGIPFKKRSK
jgi:hypothetical protein